MRSRPDLTGRTETHPDLTVKTVDTAEKTVDTVGDPGKSLPIAEEMTEATVTAKRRGIEATETQLLEVTERRMFTESHVAVTERMTGIETLTVVTEMRNGPGRRETGDTGTPIIIAGRSLWPVQEGISGKC